MHLEILAELGWVEQARANRKSADESQQSCVLVFLGCWYQIPSVRWLTQQTLCFFSEFWRLEVQDYGVIDLVSSEIFLADLTVTFLLCPPMAFAVCACTLGISFSFRRTWSCSFRTPTLWPHLTFITILKSLSTNAVTLGLELQLRGWEGNNSVYNRPDSSYFRLGGQKVSKYWTLPLLHEKSVIGII